MTPSSRRRGRPVGGGRSQSESREALVLAATTCFLRDGIGATTVERIADEADVTRSIFYRHFGGRDEVLDEVLTRLSDVYTTQLASTLEPGQRMDDYIVEALAQLVEMVRSDPHIVSLFADDSRATGGAVVGRSERLRDRSRRFVDRLLGHASDDQRAQLRSGIEVDDIVTHVILVTLALIQGYEPISDDPEALRRYLRDFAVPPLVEDP